MWKCGLKLLQVAEKGRTGLYIMHLSQKDGAFFTPGRAEKSWMAAAVVERQGAYTQEPAALLSPGHGVLAGQDKGVTSTVHEQSGRVQPGSPSTVKPAVVTVTGSRAALYQHWTLPWQPWLGGPLALCC